MVFGRTEKKNICVKEKLSPTEENTRQMGEFVQYSKN
jgi:hypothetical protein